jgi:hypothetical protein
MSDLEQVKSLFDDFSTWLENERSKADGLVGKIPPQDPCCVRTYVLKDVAKKIDKLMSDVITILATDDA